MHEFVAVFSRGCCLVKGIMSKSVKEIRILLFGDRAQDTYFLPKMPRGGHHKDEDTSQMRNDWANHPQWQRFKMNGGVDMAQALFSEWFKKDIQVASSLPYISDTEVSPVHLESLAEVSQCDKNG